MATMRRPAGTTSALALVVATAAIMLSACSGGNDSRHTGGAASCVGPQLSVDPATAQPGGTVRASGEWFAADCYDTGQGGAPPPLTGLTLQISQNDNTWTVASGVDATTDHYTFDVPVQLPDELGAGTAEIAVKGYGQPVVLHVVSK